MVGFEDDFDKQCGEYLDYLYGLAERLYSDCTDLDALVQDTIMALIVKRFQGETVEYPKGFLAAVLKNQYNGWLRRKYKDKLVEYGDIENSYVSFGQSESESALLLCEEYESVRREIGRLISLYREVVVRHYVHGQSVEQISEALGIPRGTVLSRLSVGRSQIREGLERMEKYSQISYEPKSVMISIRGNTGLNEEPLSLVRSDIEANILILAYENPLSIRGIADTMGMPSAYLEPIIDKLVKGELMGRTPKGCVYTRCFMQPYEDSFGNIHAQERLASKYADKVWDMVWSHLQPLMNRCEVLEMSEKQKGTLVLFNILKMLGEVVYQCRPVIGEELTQLPERPDAGRWLAMGTIFENGQKRDNKYDASGPVFVGYSKEENDICDCQMLDCQSLFGDAHWAYQRLPYQCSLGSILRFYASFLDCDVKTDNEFLYKMIPEFEELCILRREENGEVKLDIPALTFEEVDKYWTPACEQAKKQLYDLLSQDVRDLWLSTKNKVPKHVDGAAQFKHAGALSAYVYAQMLEIIERKLLPYPVEVGRTPLIFLIYRRKEQD